MSHHTEGSLVVIQCFLSHIWGGQILVPRGLESKFRMKLNKNNLPVVVYIHAQCGSDKECLPIFFGKAFECDETLKSSSPILWGLHAFIGWMIGPQKRDTLRNLCWSFGVLASHNRHAECSTDWDQIESWSRAKHGDTGDGHDIQGGKSSGLPCFVIVLVSAITCGSGSGLNVVRPP
jgi:hypothetical protein